MRNIEGVPKFRNWVTYPRRRPLRGQFVVHGLGKNCPRPMCVPNLKIVAFSVCEILRGSQNFEIGSRTPRPRPLRGQFVVRGQELPTAYVQAKFEDRSFFRLRNIEGVPNFRNWVTYPRPRPLRGQFVVRGQILRGSQNFEIWSRTPGHVHLGASFLSGGKNCPRPMCVPNLKGVALSVCEILAHFAALH